MAALIERINSAPRCLWLEYNAYAGALLAGGDVPWLDVDAAIGWMRKAQSLLKSDVIALPLSAVVAQWLGAHTQLQKAMAAKRRTVFPLKTLLAEMPLRAHLVELARAVRSSFPKLPLVMVLPSPRLWVTQAFAQALPADTAEIDADAVDGAAAYVADFLREFAECGIDALLLQESAGSEPASVEDLQLYQPVFNLAAHYRWDLGLRLPQALHPAAVGAGPNFIVSPKTLAGQSVGLLVPAQFWDGETAPECPEGGFRFAEIPADARPESVLERLSALR
jgi:hypothetical protein